MSDEVSLQFSPKKRNWIELIYTALLIGILFYIGIICILIILIISAKDSSPNEKLKSTKITDESETDEDNISALEFLIWIINLV